jgi:hypothetical protein
MQNEKPGKEQSPSAETAQGDLDARHGRKEVWST